MRSCSRSSAAEAASSSAFVGFLSLILRAQRVPFISIENLDRETDGALGNQPRSRPDGIVYHHPGVGKPLVEIEKVTKTPIIAPPDDTLGNRMTPTAYALINPRDRELDCRKPQVDEVNPIASGPQ